MQNQQNKQYQVLFLEDEPTIREVLKEYMLMSQYQVTETDNGDKAIALLDQSDFDIAVLDIMVPGVSGLEVLSHIKNQYPQTATIMLTALEDEKTQVDAFNRYADDYVIKPVSPIILLKRMETILRRTKQNLINSKTSSGLTFEEEAYCAYYNGKLLPLTLSEYLLLLTLYKESNRVFNREQLILKIYNEDYIGNDRIIDAHIKNLRKKLPVSCIKTIIGIGYQFDKEGAARETHS
ncbi:response regulator transcription factor [Anaerocolumna sp. AGMB13025]|uniref:response regulator transcription factor n=1 Tax=Anaerocolumna sp. AGMB13025 TaxID=3039116 RepID=UPI00242001A5|nr:response regulator transcription factor [Anaerocolumna sp. AGMB13025]WFR56733.1 response regulator transcription factor [Anaerocolumna sp. AGMB13025]